MWHSDPPEASAPPVRPRGAHETIALAALFALVPLSIWMTPGRTSGIDPAWIFMFLLSAWIGEAGFLGGVALAAGAAALEPRLGGSGGIAAPWSRLGSEADLAALGACLVVSWIASLHARRLARLDGRVRALSARAEEAEESARSLRELVEVLRSRVNRTSASLTFLRDAAARLEGKDPIEAAEAAADLALLRTGASAIVLRVGAGQCIGLSVTRELSGGGAFHPTHSRDPDLSVPLRAGGIEVGVMELWELPPGAGDEPTRHDLEIIAAWCGQAVAQVIGRTPPAPDRRLEVS